MAVHTSSCVDRGGKPCAGREDTIRLPTPMVDKVKLQKSSTRPLLRLSIAERRLSML